MMMTQEDEDLEEELRCLDIREDHGAEDSDATPINTPPTTPPILYIKKYPPTKPPDERNTRLDEYDNRSESSLSWGEDEFEGEATRQVGALFDQLDHLLYKENNPLSPIPYSCLSGDSTNSPVTLKNFAISPKHTNRECEKYEEHGYNNFSRHSSGAKSSLISQSEQLFDIDDDDESSEIFYDSGRVVPFKNPAVHQPSPELQEECSDWVQQFPHFRVRGYPLSSSMLKILDQCLDSEITSEESFNYGEEETIAQDGDFYHLLPLVTCNSANQTKEKVNPKKEASSSRVCSGSNDPEVLKEQILIRLFDRLWSSMTRIIEPLLHKYARYVIEQSVQYSSLSRESSTRGSRVGNQVFNRKVSEEFIRTKPKYAMPLDALHRPNSGTYLPKHSANRPLSSIFRPQSAVNRLQSATSVLDIHQEELQDLLQVSQKPLQSQEERVKDRTSSASTTRGSSAQSFKSQISLPALTTPRTPVHRPVSSRAANHLLTPMKVETITTGAEQRPTSTSSYNARARFQEKLQHLSRQGTIQESGSDCLEQDTEEEPSLVWSRHNSFLPPITDSGEVSSCKSNTSHQGGRPPVISKRRDSTERALTLVQDVHPQSPVMTRGNPPLTTLSVRGKPLLAAHQRPHAHPRAKKHLLGTPIIEGGRSKKLIPPSQSRRISGALRDKYKQKQS